jgi:hypothetical protein
MNDTQISNIIAAIDRLTEAVQNLGGEPTMIQTYSPPSYAPAVGAEVETVAPTPSAVAAPSIADLRDLAQALLDKGLIAAIQKVNAAHGIKRITEAHPDQYVSLQRGLLKELG